MNACVCCRQVGGKCKLSSDASQRRCRTSDGLICSGRGECMCGVCICKVSEPGMYYGPRCECHDWVCATYDGKTCGGKYYYTLFQMTNIRLALSSHWPVSGMRCKKQCNLNLWKLLSSIDECFWCFICHKLQDLIPISLPFLSLGHKPFQSALFDFFSMRAIKYYNSENCFQKKLLLWVLMLWVCCHWDVRP